MKPAARYGSNWQIIFVDLMALILAFFVLLYSVVVVPPADWDKVKESLVETLNPQDRRSPIAFDGERQVDQASSGRGQDLQYLSALLDRRFAASQNLQGWTTTRINGGLAVDVPPTDLFQPGSAVLTSEGVARLQALGEILRSVPNRLHIEVFADPAVIDRRTGIFDVWALTIEQSDILARKLQNSGYALRPMAVGRGDYAQAGVGQPLVRFVLEAARQERQVFELD